MMKRFFTSIICLAFTAAFILTDAATVEAKMKEVDLDESVVKAKVVSYKKGDYAVVGTYDGSDYLDIYLYDDTKKGDYVTSVGKTSKDNGISSDSTLNAFSHNIKNLLPDNILKKFKDGEVYIYYTVLDKVNTVYREGKMPKYAYKDLLKSSKDGSGKISAGAVKDGNDRFVLKDKNGKEIMYCYFYFKDPYEGYTTTFDDLEYSDYGSSLGFVLKAGETFPVKYQVTGGTIHTANPLSASYDTHFTKVTKKGKITAKEGVYGITYVAGYRFLITDGSTMMLKALKKWNNNNYNIADTQGCILTINKDGSYTIKKDTCFLDYTHTLMGY
jgi:hypothetical protein